MPLTNTIPLTLTGALAGHPDAVAGLVHLGDGRWYDPALGRPLQPNAAGGPPTLPQALNRYAATPLGQPGVYQAAAQQSDFLAWAQQQSIKVPVGRAVGKYLFDPRWGDAFRWGLQETGWLRISIQAEKRLIPASLEHLALISSERPGFRRRIGGLFQDGWRTAFSDAYNVEMRTGRIHRSALDLSLADAVALDLRVLDRETTRSFFLSGKAVTADLGLGIFLDVAFQVGGDWGNPYLTRSQIRRRAVVAGIGGGVSGFVGLGTAGILVWGGVSTGPAGWFGLGLGLFADWIWGDQITPLIYENLNLNPERNLQALIGN